MTPCSCSPPDSSILIKKVCKEGEKKDFKLFSIPETSFFIFSQEESFVNKSKQALLTLEKYSHGKEILEKITQLFCQIIIMESSEAQEKQELYTTPVYSHVHTVGLLLLSPQEKTGLNRDLEEIAHPFFTELAFNLLRVIHLKEDPRLDLFCDPIVWGSDYYYDAVMDWKKEHLSENALRKEVKLPERFSNRLYIDIPDKEEEDIEEENPLDRLRMEKVAQSISYLYLIKEEKKEPFLMENEFLKESTTPVEIEKEDSFSFDEDGDLCIPYHEKIELPCASIPPKERPQENLWAVAYKDIKGENPKYYIKSIETLPLFLSEKEKEKPMLKNFCHYFKTSFPLLVGRNKGEVEPVKAYKITKEEFDAFISEKSFSIRAPLA